MPKRINLQEEKPKKQAINNINYWTGNQYSERYYQILETRSKLPAFDAREPLLQLLSQYQSIILVGETGSGKTTQIPQFLLQSQFLGRRKCIACTQPRRVAAMSVAKRVAEQMDVKLGEEVGYSIRFQDKTSQKTVMKYMTDGMLLREAMIDPNLQKYSVIILDEAHERTLNTDVLFGIIKQVLKKREDLKLIVMSATMDSDKFQKYFDAPKLSIPGRIYPVEVFYALEPQPIYAQAAVKTAVQIHLEEGPGDILIFLTGQQEIETARFDIENCISEQRQKNPKVGPIVVLPLYSTLSPDQQQLIFEPAPPPNKYGIPGRKIIIATNIAETSITIDGIVYVIDPGFSKQKVFNPRMRVESLLVAPISKASAKQRAGRAGRTKPGKCFRLYTQKSYNTQLIQNTYPQIQRSNLASTVLTLKKLKIKDLVHFDLMDPPAPETLMRALQLLNYLGALDEQGELTQLGQQMSQYPLQPELAKVLLTSKKYNCMSEVLSIVSCLNVANVFIHQRDKMADVINQHAKFIHHDGDHLTLLNVYNEYIRKGSSQDWCYKNYINHRHIKSAQSVRGQLKQMLQKMNYKFSDQTNPQPNINNIKKCILSGYFTQVALLQKNNAYLTIKDAQIVAIHPGSVLKYKPNVVLYHQFVLTQKNYIRTVLQIKPIWLFEIAPKYFKPQTIKHLDTRKELKKIQKDYIDFLNKKNDETQTDKNKKKIK